MIQKINAGQGFTKNMLKELRIALANDPFKSRQPYCQLPKLATANTWPDFLSQSEHYLGKPEYYTGTSGTLVTIKSGPFENTKESMDLDDLGVHALSIKAKALFGNTLLRKVGKLTGLELGCEALC